MSDWLKMCENFSWLNFSSWFLFVDSLHEEVLAQRALDRRLTEELNRFKSTVMALNRYDPEYCSIVMLNISILMICLVEMRGFWSIHDTWCQVMIHYVWSWGQPLHRISKNPVSLVTGNNNVTMSSRSQSRSTKHQRSTIAIVSKISRGRMHHNASIYVTRNISILIWALFCTWGRKTTFHVDSPTPSQTNSLVLEIIWNKISTRFVGKPEGVSNAFFTYFDYFFGGQYKLGGLEALGGVKPPTPRQIEHWIKSLSNSDHLIQFNFFSELSAIRDHDSRVTRHAAQTQEEVRFRQFLFLQPRFIFIWFTWFVSFSSFLFIRFLLFSSFPSHDSFHSLPFLSHDLFSFLPFLSQHIRFSSLPFTRFASFSFLPFTRFLSFSFLPFAWFVLFSSFLFTRFVSFSFLPFTRFLSFSSLPFAWFVSFSSFPFTWFVSFPFLSHDSFHSLSFLTHDSFHSLPFLTHDSFHSLPFLSILASSFQLKLALIEAQKNSDLLSEYHELYELQRKRLEKQVQLLTSELQLWCDTCYTLSNKVGLWLIYRYIMWCNFLHPWFLLWHESWV